MRYVLAWEEVGVDNVAHRCPWLTLDDGSGRIVQDRLFRGGRWSASLLAKMASAGAAL